ncbi:hypothetical protein HK099_006132 [Clydaea vesicula]|uniref:Zn(2)-C6 fungal-type domain-containing protein n=1 Tax=Clydaea vesicula TaxID=447962 RepID=A0AAD5U677_9FUNG|nr:hypothetical protein HK099_006132 [Clydaea vesicula]KAJ3396317.1 hypothetical protein HDU92_003376 [Lobulomyces angularis]
MTNFNPNEFNENPSCFALDGCPLNDIEDLFQFNDNSLTAGQFFSTVDSPNTIPESPPPIIDEANSVAKIPTAEEVKIKKKRKKVAKACKECRKAHVSCDEVRPCKRCVKRNLCCSDVPDVQQKCKKCPAKVNKVKLTRNQNGVVKLNDTFEYSWSNKTNLVMKESQKLLNSPQQPLISRSNSVSSINSNNLFSESVSYQIPCSEAPNFNIFPDLEYLRLTNNENNFNNNVIQDSPNSKLQHDISTNMKYNSVNNNDMINDDYLKFNNTSKSERVMNYSNFSSHDSAIYDINNTSVNENFVYVDAINMQDQQLQNVGRNNLEKVIYKTEGDLKQQHPIQNYQNSVQNYEQPALKSLKNMNQNDLSNLNNLLNFTKKGNYNILIEKLGVIMNSPLVAMSLGEEKEAVLELFNSLKLLGAS